MGSERISGSIASKLFPNFTSRLFSLLTGWENNSRHLSQLTRTLPETFIVRSRWVDLLSIPTLAIRLPSLTSEYSKCSKHFLSTSKSNVWCPSFSPLIGMVYVKDISLNFGLQKYESF